MLVLSQAQRRDFADHGYLLVSGLIPGPVAARAEAAMARLLEEDPEASGLPRGAGPGHVVYSDPDLLALYTPDYLQAAAELAGGDPASFRPPRAAYTINLFPKPGPWEWPRPHLDHAIKEHGHRPFPHPFRIAALTYVSDVLSHGGATVVWPGSHRTVDTLARGDAERYEFMWQLSRDLSQAGIGDPLEVTARRGDVLFYHPFCAHAGSMNIRDRPRFALNMKW